MTNPARNIKNKFSDFEPEVDDLDIDKSWEEIKYFLPQEKKRRGFFWLFRSKGSRAALAVLAVFMSVATYMLLDSPGEKIADAAVNTTPAQIQNDPSLRKIENRAGHSSEPIRQAAQEPVAAVSKEKTTASQVSAEARMAIKAKRPVNPSPQLTAVSSSAVAKVNNPLPGLTHKNEMTGRDTPQQAGSNPIQQPGSTEKNAVAAAPVAGAEALSYLKLTPRTTSLVFLEPELAANTVALPKDTVVRKSVSNTLLLELFGGAGPTVTHIGRENVDHGYNHLNPDLGLGVIYKFRNRFQLNAHLVFGSNRLDTYYETVKNKVLDKAVVNSGIIPGFTGDTSISYAQLQSRTRVRSTLASSMRLGIGYSVYAGSRVELDVFCQVGLRSSAYTFDVENQFVSDTLKYVRTAGAPPLADQTTGEPLHSSERVSFRSLEVASGLTLGYAITGRVSLVFKPIYSWQLKNNTTEQKGTKFDFRQNNLALNLGLRIRLNR